MNISKKQAVVVKSVSRETQPTSESVWQDVMNIAKGEKTANGKMLYLSRDLYALYKNGKMPFELYFDETENDKSVEKIFFNSDGTHKTLIAKDFNRFTNKVLITALGKVFENFTKTFPYEYRVINDVAPLVMFYIANEKHFQLDTMLNEETDPVQLLMNWNMFSFKDIADKKLKDFRKNLVTRLFAKSEMGKQISKTFRGDDGVLEIVKTYFLPKKVEEENRTSATQSPFSKSLKNSINDVEKGILGKANLITNVVKSEQGKNTVPNNHLTSEVNELVKAGEKIISLLAGNNHPKASEGIETLYVAIVKAMTDSKGNFKTYEKTKFPRVKSSDYMPRINQKVFDLNFGDFRKYKSNI
tara:strand:+ start:650 stop:1720 length:1071 start_codon:yes stop_codon:yes gene_type:complete